jgi:hypothetical protein
MERLEERDPRTAPTERICQGTLISREQYLPDLNWGSKTPRLTTDHAMTEAEIAAWTQAIAEKGIGVSCCAGRKVPAGPRTETPRLADHHRIPILQRLARNPPPVHQRRWCCLRSSMMVWAGPARMTAWCRLMNFASICKSGVRPTLVFRPSTCDIAITLGTINSPYPHRARS